LTPLEDAKNAAEAYMHKEVEMLYRISLLERDDAEKFKEWFVNHPRYQRMEGFRTDLVRSARELISG
jgi:hypothetical protein